MYKMDIGDFHRDMEDVLRHCGVNGSSYAKQDLVPFGSFIECLRKKIGWKAHVERKDSCFMRLLKINGLFTTANPLNKCFKMI